MQRNPRLLAVFALGTVALLACTGKQGLLGNHTGDTAGTDSSAGTDHGDGSGSGTHSITGTQDSGTTTPGCGPIQLSDVAAGVGGFAVDGEGEWHGAGYSVSEAGDVNGDGLVDIIVAASGYQGPSAHRAYVVFGKTGSAPVALADVKAGHGGFFLESDVDNDDSPWVVGGAGDVNGDGFADVIVGAVRQGQWGELVPRAYVVLGKSDTEPVPLEDVANGTSGFILSSDMRAGVSPSVSGADDVNGDGLADVIVGTEMDDANGANSGRTYVVFGKSDTEVVSLQDVEQGIGGFVLDGEGEDDRSGASVGAAGDVNGDGVPDILVGAPTADPNGQSSGRTYLVFGKVDAENTALAGVAQGTGGFAMDGEAEGDEAGRTVSGAGDVNGDGLADVIVGAWYADPNGSKSGRTYVVFGRAATNRVALADIAQGDGGFALDGASAGDEAGAVSGAGDVDGDGLADVIIGAAQADPGGRVDAGRTYVVFGKANTDRISLAHVVQGDGGFALDGEAGGDDYAGGDGAGRVSEVGDVNGDGIPDILVGAPWADADGVPDAGRSYVIFGGDFSCADE
jgi:hypothetical protein